MSKIKLIYIAIYILSLFYSFIFLSDCVFYDDDYNYFINNSKSLNPKILFRSIIIPTSLGYVHTRPIYTLFLNTLNYFFNNKFNYFFIIRSIIFSFNNILLLYFFVKILKLKLKYSLLGVCLYLFYYPHYEYLSWNCDPTPFIELILLISFIIYHRNRDKTKKMNSILILFILYFISIRIKPSLVFLPIAFSIDRFLKRDKSWIFFLLIFGCSLLYIINYDINMLPSMYFKNLFKIFIGFNYINMIKYPLGVPRGNTPISLLFIFLPILVIFFIYIYKNKRNIIIWNNNYYIYIYFLLSLIYCPFYYSSVRHQINVATIFIIIMTYIFSIKEIKLDKLLYVSLLVYIIFNFSLTVKQKFTYGQERIAKYRIYKFLSKNHSKDIIIAYDAQCRLTPNNYFKINYIRNYLYRMSKDQIKNKLNNVKKHRLILICGQSYNGQPYISKNQLKHLKFITLIDSKTNNFLNKIMYFIIGNKFIKQYYIFDYNLGRKNSSFL